MVKTTLRCAGRSDPGRVRANNEDAFYLDPERGFFLVVDGIGGQAAGEKAAEIAVNRIRARLERQTGTVEQRVREAIANANNEILNAAQTNPAWQGMACVLTLAVLENGSAIVGHVGDSRLYHIRRGQIRKVTHDHSPVGEREDNREISEAEAMRHPRRNEVFRDVGSGEHTPNDPDFIEIQRIAFEPDAALLLASDGLSDQVSSVEILRAMEQHAGYPEAAVEELIAAANRAGGKDNVTVLVIEGEQFTTPPEVSVASAPASTLPGRVLFFLLGLLVAAGAAWLTRVLWQPAPVVIRPRTLVAGGEGAYPTIAAALTDARPGDTVDVVPAEYREAVRLKNGVTLRSRVPREVILRASPAGASPAVSAENVTAARLTGFRIVGDALMPLTAGILLVNSSVELDDNDIQGAGIGIEIRGAGNSVLRANGIHDCLAEGLLISGPAAPWLSHNVFERNHGPGLAARDGARPALVGNVFDKNTLQIDTPPETLRERNFLLDIKPETRGKKKQ